MSGTGYAAFDTTVQKTNEVLKEIEGHYGWPKERREQSYEALRAVLHALRDRLTVQEAADLSAQLPMLIRGLFFEGWVPSRVPLKMDRDDFLARIRHDFKFQVQDNDMERLTRVVLTALRHFISDGELKDIRSALPGDISALIQ